MKSQKIHIDSKIQLSYNYRKSENGLTLVFIHGLGSTKNDFDGAFQNTLLHQYGLLAFDLVGHFDSSTPTNFTYRMDTQAKVLKKAIGILNLNDDLIIVCHSMGGPIGIYLAEYLKDNVKGIVYAEGNLDENDCFFSLSIIEQYTSQEWFNIGFMSVLNNLKEMAEGLDLQYAQAFTKAGPISTYKSSADLVKESRKGRLFNRLIELDIPVLVIYGEHNKGKYSSEATLKKKFRINYIPNAGHDMMLRNPTIFYEVIRGFLNRYS
jgi:pimeloyl-ACP methyl ester carboxylesterase